MVFFPDVTFALRALRKRPGIVAAVVVTLALGIGANTAVFSLMDAVLLHPLAVGDPSRLVTVYEATRETPYGTSALSTYRELSARARTVAGMAASFTTTLPLGDENPLDVQVAFVTDTYFTTLGVRAARGRVLTPGESRDGSPLTVVLSGALWRTRFGADPGIVGRHVRLRGRVFTVIGVAPDNFLGTNLSAIPDAWVAVPAIGTLGIDMLSRGGEANPDVPVFTMIARLAPGVTREQAAADLDLLVRQADAAGRSSLYVQHPRAGMPVVSVVPIVESATSMSDRASLLQFMRLLFGVVALTLLLACMNVANLLIVRAGERATELGIRTALGANAGRIARQVLTENALLGLAGGGAGIAVAFVTLRLFSTFTLPGRISVDHLSLALNARVLLFTTVISLATALAVGIVPALQATRTNIIDVLRRQEGQRQSLRTRGALIAAQVAIALILLVGAGLFLRSMRAGLSTDLGFDPRPIAAVSITPKFEGRHADNVRPYLEIVSQMQKRAGVTAAAAATHVPIGGAAMRTVEIGPETGAPAADQRSVMAGIGNVTDDYFKTIGVPLVAGRTFNSADVVTAPHVMVLNESAARALWPHESPLGKLVHSRGFTYTVIGVARDTKYITLQDRTVPFAYVSIVQEDFYASVSFLARSAEPRAALDVLRQTVHTVAPDLKTPDFARLRPRLVSEQVDMILAPQRFGAELLAAFALVALCVSAVGIYGTVAYAVGQRTTEIGVRMALGAQASSILSLVLTETGIAVASGLLIGVAGTLVSSRLLAHSFSGIGAVDWLAFAGGACAVLVVAASASWIPARRAMQIDPARAMRGLQ